jgi:hypothetical protein
LRVSTIVFAEGSGDANSPRAPGGTNEERACKANVAERGA